MGGFDDDPMTGLRQQALERLMDVQASPENADKLRSFARWLAACPSHRQAFQDLGTVLASVSQNPQVLDRALAAMLLQTGVHTTQN